MQLGSVQRSVGRLSPEDDHQIEPEKAFEGELRKIATKGVVRLFNSLQEYQASRKEDGSADLSKVHIKKRGKKLEQASKDTFDNIWSQQRAGKKRKKGAVDVVDGAAAPAVNVMDEFA